MKTVLGIILLIVFTCTTTSLLQSQTAMDYLIRAEVAIEYACDSAAAEDYGRAYAMDSTLYSAYYGRIFARWAMDDTVGAIAAYTEAIKKHPGYVRAYNYRGLAKVGLKDYKGAIEDFTKALQILPNYVDALCNRGTVDKMSGDTKSAISDMKRVKVLCTNIINNTSNYSIANFGIQLPTTATTNQAQNDFNAAVQRISLLPIAYVYRGTSQMESEQEASLADYQASLAQVSVNPGAYGQCAYIGIMKGDNRFALRNYDSAIVQGFPSAEIYLGRGMCKLYLKDYAGAKQDIRVFINRQPSNPEGYICLGYVLSGSKDREGAVKEFDKAIALDSTSSAAYTAKANALTDLHDFNEALAVLNTAVSKDPQNERVWIARAQLKFQMGDADGGCKDLRKAMMSGSYQAKEMFNENCK